jgi:hypothetical protein
MTVSWNRYWPAPGLDANRSRWITATNPDEALSNRVPQIFLASLSSSACSNLDRGQRD